jgi:hypothetical protein
MKGWDGMISTIYRWSAENRLLLNPCKSQAILISNSVVGMVLVSLFLGTEEIPCDLLWGWSSMVVFLLIVKLRRCVLGFLPHCIDLLQFLTPKRVRLKLCSRTSSVFFYCNVDFSHLFSVCMWLSIAVLDMYLTCVVMATYPHVG